MAQHTAWEDDAGRPPAVKDRVEPVNDRTAAKDDVLMGDLATIRAGLGGEGLMTQSHPVSSPRNAPKAG